jgi:3-oxoacid CoA-transferase B subunit
MDHVAKDGEAKLVKKCEYPLTGVNCVNRVYTDLAVFDIINKKLVLVMMAPGVSIEEIKQKTAADFQVDEGVKFLGSAA